MLDKNSTPDDLSGLTPSLINARDQIMGKKKEIQKIRSQKIYKPVDFWRYNPPFIS